MADTVKDGSEFDDEYLKDIEYEHWRHQRRLFDQRCAEIHEELDAAMGAYMAALDDPQGKSEALTRFDAGLVRLRKVYREFGCDWDHWAAAPPNLFTPLF